MNRDLQKNISPSSNFQNSSGSAKITCFVAFKLRVFLGHLKLVGKWDLSFFAQVQVYDETDQKY